MHVLVCGASTRAAAESAARARLVVTSIDAYADLDQHPDVHALSAGRDLGVRPTAAAIAAAARSIACDAVAYLSPFENHPRAVATLAAGRTLLGNRPEVLRRVRDPLQVAATLRKHGLAVPDARAWTNDPNPVNDPNDSNVWLLKPRRSGGGQRIRAWRGGAVPRNTYLQRRIDGTPGSIVFVAAGGLAVPLGISRQIVGDANFGSSGYRYCGNILAAADDAQFDDGALLVARASALTQVVASEFDLVGVNGIDFIARDGVPYPIEVNPRWSSSMELVERLLRLSVFGAHAQACMAGALPSMDLAAELTHGRAIGKAIVFARHDSVVGDTRPWLDDPDVRDVPHPGESFKKGQPVCTVVATGADAAACYNGLVARAEQMYLELRP